MTGRSTLGLLAAVGLIGVLLVLPAPHRSVARPTAAPAVPSPTAAVPGPTLTQVWPHAHTFGFPALMPDGSTFNQLAIVDSDLPIGAITDPANTRYTFATVSTTGAVRVLKTYFVGDASSVDALAATPTTFYWHGARWPGCTTTGVDADPVRRGRQRPHRPLARTPGQRSRHSGHHRCRPGAVRQLAVRPASRRRPRLLDRRGAAASRPNCARSPCPAAESRCAGCPAPTH